MKYDDVARDLGVTVCNGCDEVSKHRDGYPGIGVVHWYDRKLNRNGLRRFLMLAIEARDPALGLMPNWMRIWTLNVEATYQAKLLGVTLPKRLSDTDRARVRFYLDEVPGDQRRYYGEAYLKAQRWATR